MDLYFFVILFLSLSIYPATVLFSTLRVDCDSLSFQVFSIDGKQFVSSIQKPDLDSVEEANRKWTPLPLQNKRRMGHTYSVAISRLPQKEQPESPFQYKGDWKERFDVYVEQHLNENRWSDPISVQQALNASNDEYTSYVRSIDEGGGYTYIYGKNICYNIRKRSVVFLVESVPHFPFNSHDAFRYGWRFSSIKQPRSLVKAVWIEDESYLTQPYTIHHIYHFVESLNFLWLKLQYINDFPVMRRLWLPLYKPAVDYAWNNAYIQLLLTTFGKNYGLQVVDRQSMRKLADHARSNLICFRRVLLLDRSHYNGDGGSLSGWMAADLFRAAAYKYSNVTLSQPDQHHPYHIALLQRTGRRRFVNLPFIQTLIKKHFGDRLEVSIHYTNGSFAEQVTLFESSDIVMSPHGAGETNIIFLRPFTVFIEAFPPFFSESTFTNLACIVRVQYFSITTYNATYLPKGVGKGVGQRLYEQGRIFQRRRRFLRALIDPEPFNVLSVVDNAVEWLHSYRYKRSVYENHLLF